MKIAIIGYGKMGHEIEKIARFKSMEIVSIIDPSDSGATHRSISQDSLRNADVCIDFTTPDAVVDNIGKISALGKNMVVGTTGWHGRLEEARDIVNKSGTGLIYASNFSIGVNIFFRIVENAAKIISSMPDYDVYGYELHHSKKLDSPSGTAKSIEQILVRNMPRKKSVPFAAVRAGSISGTHVVGFDSSTDTIELKHAAKNREGFASGAITAAQWIRGKKGFYDVDRMMDSILGDKHV